MVCVETLAIRLVGKMHNFQPLSHRISEMVQDWTKITISD